MPASHFLASGSSSSAFAYSRVHARLPDVVRVQRPVVVVAEDLRVDARLLERRPDGLDQPRLLGVAEVHPRIVVREAVLRLVLQRDRVHRHARAPVGLHELDEVLRVGVVVAIVGLEAAAEEPVGRLGVLHPRRRAPRRAHHLEVAVVAQRLAQQRQDLLLVVRDGEPRHAEVGLPHRHVVVGVVRALDEVARAHRLAQVAQADPVLGAEQVAHDRVAVLRLRQQVRGRVGDRGAEAVDPLEALGRVDRDRRHARGGRGHRRVGLLLEQVLLVPGRHPHARAVGAQCGRGPGQAGGEREDREYVTALGPHAAPPLSRWGPPVTPCAEEYPRSAGPHQGAGGRPSAFAPTSRAPWP